ncbi:hypothetical protein AB0L74_03980 [Streptomyces sp. NPDC052020]|uniref:hypothetical protein n=1 Tax=Streptomyces sp. NPDC052020 TaxID=3155677 RepID=UPI003447BA42
MGSLSVTLGAGAALAVLLAPVAPALPALPAIRTVPAAHAASGPDAAAGVRTTPARPAPGTDITLRAAGCTGKTAVAVSPAFVSDMPLAPVGDDGTLTGSGRVRSTAAAGRHEVRVRCGAAERTATLTVAGRTSPSARPAAPASPVAPVDAGGGGAARLAAEDGGRTTGPGTAHTVTGLVLAGAAAVAVALRGARRCRGTE